MLLFIQGDTTAFNTLFQRYARAMRAYLLRLSGQASAADDLVQLTFLSVVRARGRFRADARFKPWLYAIGTNVARNWIRRQRRQEALTESLPRVAELEDSPTHHLGMKRRVQEALAKLPEGQRVPIVMHRFQGLSFAEIAMAMGLTEGAVKVRAHRGYVRLRELLTMSRDEDELRSSWLEDR
ncbi:RNA polymerase sigma factor [Archangium minus]|uniref:RNA polymerase sigma factor n=2 Tax=Archangium minus TaxID=83450 RepID=A0ABY9XAJ8_9BACT|nr:RNA polymerase sigma factor [Archangium minus]